MKPRAIIILTALLACGLYGCTRQTLQKNAGLARLTPEEFPILPWSEPWRTWGPEDSVQTFDEIYECGFNLADFVTPEGLDAAKAAGLKAVVFDENTHVLDGMEKLTTAEVGQRAAAAVTSYGGHPALYAYYLRDEPGADLYPVVGRFVRAFREADPKHLSYINLFPNYADAEQMDRPTYQQYVDSFVSEVRPSYISYDHYAINPDNTVADRYWDNLEAIRTAAQKNNIPFWNIVSAVQRPDWATPSLATLRFQLYSSLAYGARGIGWYQYFNWPEGLGVDFSLAPIDVDGNRTQTWYHVRDVNMEMHRIGPVYITLKNVNAFHLNPPKWCSGIETSRFVQSLGGGDFLVGEFEDAKGRPFIIIVNKDLTQPARFELTLKKTGKVKFVDAKTGKLRPLKPSQTQLSPGQGILLKAP